MEGDSGLHFQLRKEPPIATLMHLQIPTSLGKWSCRQPPLHLSSNSIFSFASSATRICTAPLKVMLSFSMFHPNGSIVKGSFNKAAVTATSAMAVSYFPIEKVSSVEEDSRDGDDEARLTVHTKRCLLPRISPSAASFVFHLRLRYPLTSPPSD